MSDENSYRYQPSVFIGANKRRIADPHHYFGKHCWVTVKLPEGMSYQSHTDSEVMSYVYMRIQNGQVFFDGEPQHSRGKKSISLPIRWDEPYPQDEDVLLLEAKKLAAWWLHHVRKTTVTLDQRMIFETAFPFEVPALSMVDVPVSWERPFNAPWY
ncbi:uncharacterized protein N7529_009739 [Penicillium soppii]|jgi:hypothetical protein|uniref:uncharacterized protein n=1 Tax=Penicillium soppii TaxID=69789 RepID=UPI002548B404|nr:uncharacterized protein N7529_009739 [Penicillium soppii]KAJ5855795.1 hypothetical protein N7529_009739 [Penicillium soppii]